MFGRTATCCVICTNAFNATDRQTVALPCGHNYCLTCLVRLEASSPVCPQCRQSFAEVELPELQRMAKAAGYYLYAVGKKFDSMKQAELVGCKEHKEPFVYWSTTDKEFYCITCIISVNMQTANLQRIRGAIPLIHEDLLNKGRAATEGITSDRQEHKLESQKAAEELKKITTFKKSIEKLEASYIRFIEDMNSHKYKLREQAGLVKKIKGKIPEIKSEEDIEVMLSYKKILEGLQKTTIPQRGKPLAIGYHSVQTPGSNNQAKRMKRPVTLLSNIACVFTVSDD